ncbi:hypothetical protein TNCV_1508791 [Trichonephila clavipes]|nr:hypothetical protein TNCV_1508791 [Trichonephila clavipes]
MSENTPPFSGDQRSFLADHHFGDLCSSQQDAINVIDSTCCPFMQFCFITRQRRYENVVLCKRLSFRITCVVINFGSTMLSIMWQELDFRIDQGRSYRRINDMGPPTSSVVFLTFSTKIC